MKDSFRRTPKKSKYLNEEKDEDKETQRER